MINFVDRGGKANDPNAGTTNLDLLHSLLANNKVDNEGFVNNYGDAAEWRDPSNPSQGVIVHHSVGGTRIYFPPRSLPFQRPYPSTECMPPPGFGCRDTSGS